MFNSMYWRGVTPWDTGITPPELRAVIEGPGALAPGRALDIGCGTGLNSVYLATHGWDVTGIDFAAPAIARARRRLSAANATVGQSLPVQLLHGDATRLRAEGVRGPFTLVFDLGCLHGIPRENRTSYAEEVAALTEPGALYLLYTFTSTEGTGMSDEEIATLFSRTFRIERIERGEDRGSRPSAWRWMRRIS
jgi:cyclopropane fatty-acyl-phospholipid synthase-like methyltransferase